MKIRESVWVNVNKYGDIDGLGRRNVKACKIKISIYKIIKYLNYKIISFY